jgi:hypothetical protein
VIRLSLFYRFVAGEGVKMILASDLNMQLKMNVRILYICELGCIFFVFFIYPESFSHRTYRNYLTWLPSLSYVVQSNKGTFNSHRQQWVFNLSSLLVAALTVTIFALQPVAVRAGRMGSVNFFGTMSYLYCRQRFLALLSAGQLLVTH